MANEARRLRREFEQRRRRLAKRYAWWYYGYIKAVWPSREHYNIQIQEVLLLCYGLVVFMVVIYMMTDDNILTDIRDYYNYHSNNVQIKLSNEAGVFINSALRFLEIFWQVLYYIGSWFLRGILHFSTLLLAHFPGGIPGIAFVIIIAFLLRKVRKLSKAYTCMKDQQEVYTRCVKDKQELQLILEDITLKLQEEIGKLNKESEKVEKLRLSLEEEKDRRLCGICQDQIKTIVLLPCQHMCLCKPCLDRKKWKKCPMCRQRVESTMEVYV